jgi:hypothetical protein
VSDREFIGETEARLQLSVESESYESSEVKF